MVVKAPARYLSQPSDSSSSSSSHRQGTAASMCIVLLGSCTCTTVAFFTFFSNELQLPMPWRWRSTCSSDSPNRIPTPTDLSHIVFGIAGSAQTWEQRRVYAELWWRPNQTRGHVWLDRAPTGSWPEMCPTFRISRDTSRYGKLAAASRIAAIVAEAYNESESDVRWFVMGDDDTVFFVENLVAVLQKYDHQQMYYVGMTSEAVEQNVWHSYRMAFGGGGFAISYPAAAQLAKIMDGCLDRYVNLYGSDHRVQSCLAELGIPLTREPGFHQVDLKGDVYGMLAAHPVAPLVSLHHLDYVESIMGPMKHSQLESIQSLFFAYRADPARILQQTFCYEKSKSGSEGTWSVSTSWGYTVQVYPWVLPQNELEIPLQNFKTWQNSHNGPFIFNTRPFESKDPCKRPFIFFLDSISRHAEKTTLTEYTRSNTSESKCDKSSFSAASNIDRVRVFAPKMDPFLWKQAPRRHCCMTQRTNLGRILEVRIKTCDPGESTIPPISN